MKIHCDLFRQHAFPIFVVIAEDGTCNVPQEVIFLGWHPVGNNGWCIVREIIDDLVACICGNYKGNISQLFWLHESAHFNMLSILWKVCTHVFPWEYLIWNTLRRWNPFLLSLPHSAGMKRTRRRVLHSPRRASRGRRWWRVSKEAGGKSSSEESDHVSP